MPRPLHLDFPGALYHVSSRGVDRKPVFREDRDYRLFISLLHQTVDDGSLVVHAFCLMTNHFHILCETPRGGLRPPPVSRATGVDDPSLC